MEGRPFEVRASRDYAYRRLVVWQKAMQLVSLVYAEVARFPADEKFALADQLKRAIVSVPSNIAEGNGRATNKDYAHFLSMARGSLYEAMTQLEISRNLGYVSINPEIEALEVELRRMLTALIKRYIPLN